MKSIFKWLGRAFVLVLLLIGLGAVLQFVTPPEDTTADPNAEQEIKQPAVSPSSEPSSAQPETEASLVAESSPDNNEESLADLDSDAPDDTVRTEINVDILSCAAPVDVDVKYSNPVPVRQIAADIVEQWGLKIGALDVFPKDETRTFYWVSNAPAALFVLTRDTDLTWYHDGDTVRFIDRNDPILETLGLTARRFELKVDPTDGGLMVAVDSDLADSQEIRMKIYRLYFEDGSTDAFSGSYGRFCGLAAQWRVPKFIPIDDEAWKADLVAHQDQMGLLGEEMAFSIEAISDHVEIEARSRFNRTEASVLLPLTVSIRSESDLFGGDHLKLWESYELLAEAPLVARVSSSTERGRRLNIGEVFRVEAIEHSQLERWYLVTVGDRQGWINSIALLREGVKRVATLTDREQKASDYHQILMGNVFGPCLDYAHDEVAKGTVGESHSIRLAMVENSLPLINDMVSELMEMDLGLLAESEIQEFYRESLANCKAGVRDGT